MSKAIATIKIMISQIEEKQKSIIEGLQGKYNLNYLFDLAVAFEDYYREVSTTGRSTLLQRGITTLSNCIAKLIQHKAEPLLLDQRPLEKFHQGWLKRLSRNKGKHRLQHPIFQLLFLEIQILVLQDLLQIQKADRSCEVKIDANGKLTTCVVHEQGFRHEIKTIWKYHYLTHYYYMFGFYATGILEEEEMFSPKGQHELDIEASRGIQINTLAALDYIEHFGLRNAFTWHGKTYTVSLLVQILSFFNQYFQARYGLVDYLLSKTDSYTAIRTTMESQQKAEEKTIGPLIWMDWQELVSQTRDVFPRLSKKNLKKHLEYLTTSSIEAVDILYTPFLKFKEKVCFFVRPLILQNSWMPVLNGTLSLTGKDEENKRSERSAERLGSLFEEHGFSTIINEDYYENGQLVSDIDLAAFKDGHLFLMELKATIPKQNPTDYKSHINDTLRKKAKRQLRKAYQYLEKNWGWAQDHLSINDSWDEVEIHRIIISTTFEADRIPIFGEALKISQFELERYLKNDAWLCLEEEDLQLKTAQQIAEGFYPKGTPLSGELLRQLIEEEALWSFLDEKLNNTDIDAFLPCYDFGALEKILR